MSSSVTVTLKITALLLVLLMAGLALLRLLDVVTAEDFGDLAMKSGAGVLLLGLCGTAVAALSGSKTNADS